MSSAAGSAVHRRRLRAGPWDAAGGRRCAPAADPQRGARP
ncbi:Hypothetical protein I596_3271 [Dokdonella koreensis DS-123]|uniref:Uncharacterized protein n=1 Tax=Dokdonella koreensis DS-123 TaxID=1300342 RepID=A0A160DXY6_9GAMM|nr:Hypothetical protein I596_3271 [Dokdonella koreensis DS-123]